MEINLRIRKINEADFDFIYDALCDLENKIMERTSLEQIFKYNISNSNYLYLIAENGLENIGFITFHTQKLMHHGGLVGEIQEFYVIPGYRGKGVGRQLLNSVFEYAEENNLKGIEVQTNKRRVENVAVYQSLGFKLTHNKFTIFK
jgi:PhnO protein